MRTFAFRLPGRHAAPLLAAACALPACGSAPAIVDATPPAYEPDQEAKSRIHADPLKPLIVEWPATSRSQLETLIRRGPVAVRYDGRTMELLPDCSFEGESTYAYAGTNVHRDTLVISSADQLAAHLPLGVASLSGELADRGRLEVSLTVVGAYALEGEPARVTEAEACATATHYVSSLSAGAYRLSAGGAAKAAASVDVGGVGTAGSTERQREELNRAGDERACEVSTPSDLAPPPGCGALLRVTLAAVTRPPPGEDPLVVPAPIDPGPDGPEVDPGVDPSAPVDPADPGPADPGPGDPASAPAAPTGPASEPIDPAPSPPAPIAAPAPAPAPEPWPPASTSPSSPGPSQGAPAEQPSGDSTWGYIGVGALVAALVGLVVAGAVVAANKEDPPRPERPTGGLGSVDLGATVEVAF